MIRNRNLVFGTAGASSPDLDKGFQLPKIATASLPTAAAAYEGMIVYDTTTNKLKVCSDSSGSYAWEGIDSAA